MNNGIFVYRVYTLISKRSLESTLLVRYYSEPRHWEVGRPDRLIAALFAPSYTLGTFLVLGEKKER